MIDLYNLYSHLPEFIQRPIVNWALKRACNQLNETNYWLAYNLADYSHDDLSDDGFDKLSLIVAIKFTGDKEQ